MNQKGRNPRQLRASREAVRALYRAPQQRLSRAVAFLLRAVRGGKVAQ